MSKRLNNFEALRIVAMFMVITLHYLGKGWFLTTATEPFSKISYMAWLIEAFAIVSVNIYVLITGYFMCESSMKVSRLLQIVFQVLWYSILIPVVLSFIGIVDLGGFQLYELLQFFFPIHMEHYWFATAYVVLLLFVPFLNIGIRYMSQKKLLIVTVMMTMYQVLPKSIVPVKFKDDAAGYNVLWLICLYLIAAYIRKYGIPFFTSFKRSLLCYLLGVFAIFAGLIIMRLIYFRWDVFGDSITFTYHYNHLACLFASVSLFYTFLYWKIKDGIINRVIGKAAPYTFGAYLLHEHILIRMAWPGWLKVVPADNLAVFVWSLLWKVSFVLVVGMAIDWFRACVFKLVGKGMAQTPIVKVIGKLDEIVRN